MNQQQEVEVTNAEVLPAEGEPKFEIRGFNTEPEPAAEQMSAEEADRIALGAEEAPAPEAEAPKKEPKVKIGSREFETADEAWAYAQELEQQKLVADAFQHGIETASQGQLGNP